MMNQNLQRLLILIFCGCVFWQIQISDAQAQDTVTGAFRGRLTDKQNPNQGVALATIQFVNTETNVPSATRTDTDGNFYKGLLRPGLYKIRAIKEGYQVNEFTRQLIVNRPNEVVPLPITIESLASLASSATPTPTSTTTTQTVTLTPDEKKEVEQNALVESAVTTETRRSGVFTEKEVTSLTLGSTTLVRTFDQFGFLVPGVALAPLTEGNGTGPGVGAGVGSAGQFAVNGIRSRANNFTVDGSDNNDEDIGVRRQGFFSLVPQPIESIKEFQIITLLAPAQFGRNIGAQVNAVSKSGGNLFNGTLYGLFNSDKLNARNYFDNLGDNSPLALTVGSRAVRINNQPATVRRNFGNEDPLTLAQGGFAVGGPIVKQKFFFFVSGEGQLLNATKESSFAVPTISQRGAFGSGATGLRFTCRPNGTNTVIVPARFPTSLPVSGCPDTPDTVVDNYATTISGDEIFSFFPFPNNPNGIYGANTLTQVLPADARGLILSGKLDYNFDFGSKAQSITARYNFTDDRRDLPVTGGALFSSLRPEVQTNNLSMFWNSEISNSIFNQFRFSFGSTDLEFVELRDTEFLRPVRTRFNNQNDSRFLLNVPVLYNTTFPSDTFVYYDAGGYETDSAISEVGLVGQVKIAGFSPIGVDVFNFPQQRKNNTFQFADNLSWQINKNQFVFGTDIRLSELNSDLPRNSRPLVTFNGSPLLSFGSGSSSLIPMGGFVRPEDFAASGAASGFFQSLVLPGRDAKINLRYSQLNFFAQDDWRISRNATLSLGVRYEYNTPAAEKDNKIEETFNSETLRSLLNNSQLQNAIGGYPSYLEGRTRIFDADTNNFASRIGFVYSPNFGGERATVIRVGTGIFYDQILGAVVSQSRNVFPTFLTANFGGGPEPDRYSLRLFNPITASVHGRSLVQAGNLNTLNISTALPLLEIIRQIYLYFPSFSGTPFGATLPQRRLDTPWAVHSTVSIEQQLTKTDFISIAYINTLGRDLLRFTSPNLGNNYLTVLSEFELGPESDATGIFYGSTLDPVTSLSRLRRPVGNIGPISRFETTGESRYDALQISLRGRLSQRFQYQMGYTFSKVTDDVSDVFDLAGASVLPQNSLTFAGERAAANFDARHRLSYAFVLDLPEMKDSGAFTRFFIGGWQISGIGSFQTGQPFTVNSIFDVNLDGNLTDRLNNTSGLTLTGSRRQPLTVSGNLESMLAGVGQDGAVPRNSFRAGNILEMDLSLMKHFIFTERQRITFRVDFFNFINRTNFGIPVRFLEAPGFGKATDTVTPAGRIQLGLKYTF